MVETLAPAFTARGMTLGPVDWRAPIEVFDGVAAALIGTPWDYFDLAGKFIARLDELEALGIPVLNSPQVVRWNIEKTYLRDLEERGASTIPTLWLDDAGREDILAALDRFATDSVVVKRQVGGGALGQHRFARDNLPTENWRMGHPAMIQPFLPAIVEEGEISLIFIAGEFSHALRKLAAKGDYRIQSLFGGREEDFAPSPAELAEAGAVLAACPFPAPLYARIDIVRLPSGKLAVMEAELIEPYLYPDQGPELGPRLAAALARRIS
jgi:glutathione synthase/RimK-type ligase-like ATP-grasp enzyme